MKILKKCPACGIQYQDSQDFCSKCGAKLEAASPAF
ncbi:MAG: zinc-ribbon domain-containing protein, partial [Synergistaceae bacterium]|nr:zinc-ribbon domain-containing protein [Synergistaceae bacterium]